MMIKRMLTISLAILLAASVAACSPAEEEHSVIAPETSATEPETAPTEPEPDPSTPQGTVIELFQGAKRWDTEAVNACLPAGVTVDQYVPAGLQDSLIQVLGRMDYKVGETAVDGDHATVALEITAIDAEGAMNEAVTAAIGYLAKKKLTGQPTDDYAAMIEEVVASINIAALPTKTEAATAHLVRGGDSEWKLNISDEANLPLLNAVSGGSVEIAGQFRSLAESYGISLAG